MDLFEDKAIYWFHIVVVAENAKHKEYFLELKWNGSFEGFEVTDINKTKYDGG